MANWANAILGTTWWQKLIDCNIKIINCFILASSALTGSPGNGLSRLRLRYGEQILWESLDPSFLCQGTDLQENDDSIWSQWPQECSFNHRCLLSRSEQMLAVLWIDCWICCYRMMYYTKMINNKSIFYNNYPTTSNALRPALDATRAPRQTPAPQKVNIKRHGRAESRREPCVCLSKIRRSKQPHTVQVLVFGEGIVHCHHLPKQKKKRPESDYTCFSTKRHCRVCLRVLASLQSMHQNIDTMMPDQTAEPPKSRDTSLEFPSRYRLHGLAGLLPAGV